MMTRHSLWPLLFLVGAALSHASLEVPSNPAVFGDITAQAEHIMQCRKQCLLNSMQHNNSSTDPSQQCNQTCHLVVHLGISLQANCSQHICCMKYCYLEKDGQNVALTFCDMTTPGGGWTVIQRRVDDSVDFFRGWEDYKRGFGDPSGNFWIGLELLHQLTVEDCELYVYLQADATDHAYASYSSFRVAGEEDNYRLTVSGYSGTAGDSMMKHNGMQFSTKDQDNDQIDLNCASRARGAWWYLGCHDSNLNGPYINGLQTTDGRGINWRTYRGTFYSLAQVEMKVRRRK